MKCTIVIAAYDENQNIEPLTHRLVSTMSGTGWAWELIYVIEGTDGTYDIAQRLAACRPEIRILYRANPSGLGGAFRWGFDAVTPDTDVLVTMDADLNHQPEEIPRLVRALGERHADIVVGSRKLAGSVIQGAPFWKTALSNAVNRLVRVLIGMPVADQTSGYRAYRYAAFRRLSFRNDGFAFLPEILLHAHALRMRMVEEPIQFIFRTAGESKMKLLSTSRSYLALLVARFFSRNATMKP
jgi:dolichol-phosphate mannosyltransferase